MSEKCNNNMNNSPGTTWTIVSVISFLGRCAYNTSEDVCIMSSTIEAYLPKTLTCQESPEPTAFFFSEFLTTNAFHRMNDRMNGEKKLFGGVHF